MNWLDKILRRPRAVLSAMIVLVISGLIAYVTIPKESNPDITIPVFYISTSLSGISPQDAERLLIKPIEVKLRGLEGLKQINSIASEGHAGIIVEFESEVDTDKAGRDVREKVDQAAPDLPADANTPTISDINFSLQPTILVAVSGDVPERTLDAKAKELQDAIERIPSVLSAELTGQRDEVLEIIVNKQKLESYGLAPADIYNIVSRNNLLVAAGSSESANGRFSVKVPGLVQSATDLLNLPIKTFEGTVVVLQDVAEVRRTFQDRTRFALYNGRPAITIEVVKRQGTNIIENNEEVKKVAETLLKSWPSAMHIDYALDQSNTIKDVLQSLEDGVILAIILVMVLVVASLGIRSGILVGISIPTSFLIGFLVIAMMGYTVNIMIMFGLILSVGILVDGSIVLAEYADRKMAEGVVPKEAYIAAAKRMFVPILASMATTIAAFIPLLFWPGIAGEFMSYLPVTVITVLAASLVTAMVFVPAVGFFIGKTDKETMEQFGHFADDEHADFRKMKGLTGLYLRFIERIIRHPLLVGAAVFGLMGGIVTTFAIFPTGVEFFVDTEPEQVNVYVRARGNLGNPEQLALTRQVENLVVKVEGIKTYATYAGTKSGGGNIMGDQDVPADVVGQIQLELHPVGHRKPWKELQKELEAAVAGVPGSFVEIRALEGGPPSGKDIRLQITAADRDAAFAAAHKIEDHMINGMEGIRDIDDDLPLPGYEWSLTVDREEAGRFGADILSAGTLVQLATTGAKVGSYRPDDSKDEIDIRVRLPESERSITAVQDMKLTTPNGLVPMSNFVKQSVKPLVNVLYRFDGAPSIFVKANAAPGFLGNDKVQELEQWIGKQTWPQGVVFKFRGADEDQQKSSEFLMKALAASVFMMFMILIVQYNSFYHVMITLSTVIMSTVGVLLGMLVTGQYFSVIMTGTGIMALGGVVVSHSIVLIDTFHRLRDAGQNGVEAAIRTCSQRMRPVLLTSITAMLGLLPMVFELNVNFFTRHIAIGSMTSAWWVHLSTAMVFGLLLATVLTLIMTPVLLAAPTVFREARTARRERKVIAKMVKAATAADGKPGNDNEQIAAAMKQAAE
ncbi:MAG TPA: efflux RND transporter permease subunit [Aestuariivirga sp.]|nr:efflux RND transporter permease subunit [Aestuariivirga sp.]